MTLHWIDYSLILLYLMGILAFGLYLQKRASASIDAYFLGSRNIPWWALGASGMASNTDIAGTMVIAALIYSLGTKAFFIEIRGGVVLVMAFFMIFMGKWTRRAQVMTLAEWMTLRFGRGREGQIARIISALANLIVSIWIISFFAVGGGKFIGELVGIPDQLASVILIVLAMIYTVVSGFHGVIWTDVVQGGLIFVAVIYVCLLAMTTVTLPETFQVSLPLEGGQFQLVTVQLSEWASLWPPANLDLPGQYGAYNLFQVTIFFYLLKTCIEGFGGAGGYMSQRYFAAKSDRDAGLLSLCWIGLLAFRWPLVMSFALLAIHHGMVNTPIQDPELVLPTVLAHYIPIGAKGLLIACFMAAAMSTFDSLINSSAAYWVKDIYQAYLNPAASDKQLLIHGRWASFLVVFLGILLSFPVVNINDIWGWITMAFGTGVFIPLVLRWYWWRFNGYGFAWGTVGGMVAAVGTRMLGFSLPEYMNFLVPASVALLGCLLGTYLTAPTDSQVLEKFFRTTRPFGFWGPVRQQLSQAEQLAIQTEGRRDLLAIGLAVPWQLVLFLTGMVFVMKQWMLFGLLALIWGLLSLGLYFTWFRHLSNLDQEQPTT